MTKIINWFTPLKALHIIVFLGLIVYGNTLFNGFVWDDEEQIVKNTIIHSLQNFPEIFSGATFSTGGAGLSGWFFRPFLTFFYMANYALWGANAFGFHLVQMIFHIINACLLFVVLEILLNKDKKKPILLVNLLISSFFVVHAGISEAVSYIAAVSEVLFTFFNLVAFLLILKNSQPSLKKITLVCSLLFLGLLNKESSIIIFPILLFYLLLFKNPAWKRWFISLFSTMGIYFFVRLGIVQTPIQHPEFSPISEAPLWERILTIPLELVHYIGLLFYPQALAVSQHFVVRTPTLEDFYIPLLLVTLFLGTLLFLAYQLRSKVILFGLVWFLVGFGLISNIFPLDMTIAERWLYFPSVGLFITFAAILAFASSKKVFGTSLILGLLVLLPILGVRTMVRNSNWHDGLTLYSHDVTVSHNSFDLENNLGVELFRIGQKAEAKKHFENSVALQPKWHFALNNLGAAYQSEGNTPKAKELYSKVLEVSDYYLAHENMANILILEDPQKAKEFTDNSLKKLPNNPNLWFANAVANYKLGNKEAALVAAKNSFQLYPTRQTQYVITKLEQNQPIEF